MSTDFKIELFAYSCFYKLWLEMGLKRTELNIIDIYVDECLKDKNYLEACNLMLINGVRCRLALFKPLYLKEFDLEKVIKWRSLSDCYDHITSVCDRHDWFGHLTVFERMLATCAYVQYLCARIYTSCRKINVVQYGHIIWAMYFDKFAEKFYEEGGWNELKREVSKGVSLSKVVEYLTLKNRRGYLREARETTLNYWQSRGAIKYSYSKNKRKGRVHISKLWVEFHIEYFKDYVKIPLSYEDSADWIEVELLMQHLKLIGNYLAYGCGDDQILKDEIKRYFCSTGILFFKTSDKSKEIKSREDIGLENIRIGRTACNEFLDSRKWLETQRQNYCSTQSEKVTINENIKKTDNELKYPEMEKSGKKIGEHLDGNCPNGCSITDETTNPPFDTKTDYNIANIRLENKNEKYSDNNSVKKEKRQRELLPAGNASSLHRKAETKWHLKSPSKDLPNSVNSYPENEVSKKFKERESPKSPLNSSFYITNEGYHSNTKQSCAFFTDQIAISQYERNSIPDKLSTRKDFFSVKEVTQTENEMKDTNQNLDKLREEQADAKCNNFFKNDSGIM